jgi:LysM repeat protein
MGLFSFVRSAGEKLFGGDEPEPRPQREVDPAKVEVLKRTRALEALVTRLGLGVEDLRIEVQGETATVSGKVASQAEREKIILAVGNVAGIARVDDRLETTRKEPEAQFHTVVPGDTLSKIAKAYYGDSAKYSLIFEANRPMLTDPDKIYPGQVLRVPPFAA